MKSRLLLATYTLLVSANAFAQGWTGWHPTAWDTPRLASPEVVRVQAVTNGPFVFTNYLPQWNQVVDGASTNYVYGWPPDGSCSTNKVISTNAFLSDIVANAGALDTGAVVNTWSFDLNNCTGVAYTVTRTVTNYPAWKYLYLQARDVWAYDAYLAAYERWSVVQNDKSIEKPRYYRDNRAALVEVKQWIANNCTEFVWTNWVFQDFLTNAVPVYQETNLVQMLQLPSNYLHHTPWRFLGINHGGMSNVVRGSLAMVGRYDTNGVALVQTNITVDTCGNTVTNIGAYTNGQLVAFVCTNATIMAGYTESDYGWKNIQLIFSNLVTVAYDAGYAGVYHVRTNGAAASADINGDIYGEFQNVWNTYRENFSAPIQTSYTGMVSGAWASYGGSINYSGNSKNDIDMAWGYNVTVDQRYAIPLPKSNSIGVVASRVIAYANEPRSITPYPVPCDFYDITPLVIPARFYEIDVPTTNNIPEKREISTTYERTAGVYTYANQWKNGNVLRFGSAVAVDFPSGNPTAPEGVYGDVDECGEPLPLEGQRFVGGGWPYVLPKIYVRWNFERK